MSRESLVDTRGAVALSAADHDPHPGGAVFDALVGACAKQHGLALATRGWRALETYRALEVDVELLA